MKHVLNTLGLAALLITSPTLHAADPGAGKAGFERVCAACHLPTGEGVPGAIPPLKQSDFFKKAKPEQLVKILANGLNGEVVVKGQHYVSAMPPQELSEEDAAAILNYVSTALNGGKNILTPEQVKKFRAAK